tara:strand:+ start:299 stop:514 length:216 start_codon:yes stop_codon:yes gene_type:complete
MGSVGARLKTPAQGKNFGRVLQERQKIGAKEFEKKYRPRIIATRKAEKKRFAKMESESSEYTLGKKTLLGA